MVYPQAIWPVYVEYAPVALVCPNSLEYNKRDCSAGDYSLAYLAWQCLQVLVSSSNVELTISCLDNFFDSIIFRWHYSEMYLAGIGSWIKLYKIGFFIEALTSEVEILDITHQAAPFCTPSRSVKVLEEKRTYFGHIASGLALNPAVSFPKNAGHHSVAEARQILKRSISEELLYGRSTLFLRD